MSDCATRWTAALLLSSVLLPLCGCDRAVPEPESRLLRAFQVGTDTPLASDVVSVEGDAWLIVPGETRSVKLFELENPASNATALEYRARVATAALDGRSYLEMYVRLPGRGLFAVRSDDRPFERTSGWADSTVRFELRPGERPDLIQLGVVFEGAEGRVSIKDVTLYQVRAPD